jgi:hypothetical protein
VVRPEKALRYGWCIGSTRPPACRSAELQSIPCATHTAAADAVGPANRRLAQAPPAPIATAAAVDEAFINKSKEQARHQRLAALTLIWHVHFVQRSYELLLYLVDPQRSETGTILDGPAFDRNPRLSAQCAAYPRVGVPSTQ